MHGLLKHLIPISLCLMVFPVAAEEWNGNINFSFGYKNINDPFFDGFDADAHFQVGMMVDLTHSSWPVSIALDRFRSHRSLTLTAVDALIFAGTVRVEMTTEEYNLGLRKIWQPSKRTRPYLGAGLVQSEVEYSEKVPFQDEQADSDDGIGYWYGGGLYFTLARHFNIGLDLRRSHVDVTLFGKTVDAGGTSTSLFIGFHW